MPNATKKVYYINFIFQNKRRSLQTYLTIRAKTKFKLILVNYKYNIY